MQLGNADDFAASEVLAGLGIHFARAKVPSGGGLSFELTEEDADGNTDSKEITAVILYHHPLQTYYRSQYNGGNERPDCGSMDGVTGSGTPGGICASCRLNQFGTAENNGKACKQRHRLYILREGEYFPMILDLPTGSVKGFGSYMKRLINRRRNPSLVVTSFKLQKALSAGGISYSQVVFNNVRDLTIDEHTILSSLSEQVKAFSKSVDYYEDQQYIAPDDDQYVASDGQAYQIDPETGEVMGA